MNRSEIDQFCKTKSKEWQYYKHYFFFTLEFIITYVTFQM